MKNGKNGITLIALIITIILMLILASVAINVAIDGGLFNQAGKAINNTEIASEKETVQKATVLAESTSKTGRISVEEMQKAINSITQENSAVVIDNGETLVVKFNESNRYYEIDNKGNVAQYEVIFDDNPGNIKVGINGENLDGTETKPYEIWCIEDLVEWSNNYSEYKTSHINLCRTLNFKSSLSYADSKRTDYGDLNQNGELEEILTELTNTGEGCIGFTPIRQYSGTFNGQGYEIKNIYINVDGSAGREEAGFFGRLDDGAMVCNFSVSGEVFGTKARWCGWFN